MGYDVERFQEMVDEELICSICSGVLEAPVQIKQCEHNFCRACIEQWLAQRPTCPVDRSTINASSLCAVPRIVTTLLSRLNIACEYAAYGCTQVLKLEVLSRHLRVCPHNPDIPAPSGVRTPRNQRNHHDRISELSAICRAQNKQIDELRAEIRILKLDVDEFKNQVSVLLHVMGQSDRAENSTAEQANELGFLRWCSSLTRKTVGCWGNLISTPDEGLETAIAHALEDSGCPRPLMESLMRNCCECKWPTGLNTLEIRQTNRHIYENYVCHRIPGEQAVVALGHLNSHMPAELMVAPGLVFIFAEGIE